MNLVPWRRKRSSESSTGLLESPVGHLRSEIDTLFGKLFDEGFGGFGLRGAFPSADLTESEKLVTVTLELPGVDPEHVDIQITGGVLTVCGEKRQEHQEKDASYLYTERSYGSFQRSIELPRYVDPENVDATYKHGVLTIRIAKRPDAQPKRIALKQS